MISPLLEEFRQLWKSEYSRNIAKMATGTVVAQIIGIMLTPVITRLYHPDVYGVFASYLAMAGIISAISGLRYELAIVLPHADAEASALLRFSTISALSMTVLTVLAIAVHKLVLPIKYLAPLDSFVFLLPATALVLAGYNFITCWANRAKAYTVMSSSKVASSLTNPLVAIALFYLVGPRPVSLAVASMLATLLVMSIVLHGLFRLERLPQLMGADRMPLWEVAHRYRQFPKYNLPMTLMDQFTSSLPLFMFTTLFSPALAAFFALATNVLRLPLTLVGQSVSQVFLEEAARSREDASRLKRLTVRNIKLLSAAAAVTMLPVILFGPWLFGLVFGQQWAEAGTFAQLMAFMAGAALIGSPISTLPSVLNKQHVHLLLSIVSIVMRLLAIWIGAKANSAMVTIAFFTFFEVLNTIIFVGWLLVLLNRAEKKEAGLAKTDAPA